MRPATCLLVVVLLGLGWLVQGVGATEHWPGLLGPLARVWLHENWLHLGGNVVFLLVFGTVLERALGARFLLLAWFAGALGGVALSMLLEPGLISLGSSGAVFGLIGATLVAIWRRPGAIPGHPVALSLALLALILSGLQSTKMGWAVDRMSHLGGCLAGLAISAAALRSGGTWWTAGGSTPDRAPESAP